jgi:hypothetical protein
LKLRIAQDIIPPRVISFIFPASVLCRVLKDGYLSATGQRP